MLFSINHQETLKKQRFFISKTWRLHSPQQGGERGAGEGSVWAFNFVFTGVEGGGLRFPGSLFIDEYKIKKKEFKAQEQKRQVAPTISYWNQPRSVKQRCLSRAKRPDSIFGQEACTVFIQIAIVDSLQSKLKSCICITKRNTSCQGLHCRDAHISWMADLVTPTAFPQVTGKETQSHWLRKTLPLFSFHVPPGRAHPPPWLSEPSIYSYK